MSGQTASTGRARSRGLMPATWTSAAAVPTCTPATGLTVSLCVASRIDSLIYLIHLTLKTCRGATQTALPQPSKPIKLHKSNKQALTPPPRWRARAPLVGAPSVLPNNIITHHHETSHPPHRPLVHIRHVRCSCPGSGSHNVPNGCTRCVWCIGCEYGRYFTSFSIARRSIGYGGIYRNPDHADGRQGL